MASSSSSSFMSNTFLNLFFTYSSDDGYNNENDNDYDSDDSSTSCSSNSTESSARVGVSSVEPHTRQTEKITARSPRSSPRSSPKRSPEKRRTVLPSDFLIATSTAVVDANYFNNNTESSPNLANMAPIWYQNNVNTQSSIEDNNLISSVQRDTYLEGSKKGRYYYLDEVNEQGTNVKQLYSVEKIVSTNPSVADRVGRDVLLSPHKEMSSLSLRTSSPNPPPPPLQEYQGRYFNPDSVMNTTATSPHHQRHERNPTVTPSPTSTTKALMNEDEKTATPISAVVQDTVQQILLSDSTTGRKNGEAYPPGSSSHSQTSTLLFEYPSSIGDSASVDSLMLNKYDGYFSTESHHQQQLERQHRNQTLDSSDNGSGSITSNPNNQINNAYLLSSSSFVPQQQHEQEQRQQQHNILNVTEDSIEITMEALMPTSISSPALAVSPPSPLVVSPVTPLSTTTPLVQLNACVNDIEQYSSSGSGRNSTLPLIDIVHSPHTAMPNKTLTSSSSCHNDSNPNNNFITNSVAAADSNNKRCTTNQQQQPITTTTSSASFMSSYTELDTQSHVLSHSSHKSKRAFSMSQLQLQRSNSRSTNNNSNVLSWSQRHLDINAEQRISEDEEAPASCSEQQLTTNLDDDAVNDDDESLLHLDTDDEKFDDDMNDYHHCNTTAVTMQEQNGDSRNHCRYNDGSNNTCRMQDEKKSSDTQITQLICESATTGDHDDNSHALMTSPPQRIQNKQQIRQQRQHQISVLNPTETTPLQKCGTLAPPDKRILSSGDTTSISSSSLKGVVTSVPSNNSSRSCSQVSNCNILSSTLEATAAVSQTSSSHENHDKLVNDATSINSGDGSISGSSRDSSSRHSQLLWDAPVPSSSCPPPLTGLIRPTSSKSTLPISQQLFPPSTLMQMGLLPLAGNTKRGGKDEGVNWGGLQHTPFLLEHKNKQKQTSSPNSGTIRYSPRRLSPVAGDKHHHTSNMSLSFNGDGGVCTALQQARKKTKPPMKRKSSSNNNSNIVAMQSNNRNSKSNISNRDNDNNKPLCESDFALLQREEEEKEDMKLRRQETRYLSSMALVLQRVWRGCRSRNDLLKQMGIAKRQRHEPRIQPRNQSRIQSQIRRRARALLRYQTQQQECFVRLSCRQQHQHSSITSRFRPKSLILAIRKVCANAIQIWYRHHVNRKRVTLGVVTMQTVWRGLLTRCKFCKMVMAAIQIQSIYRGYNSRIRVWNYPAVLASTKLIQTNLRGYLARKQYHKTLVGLKALHHYAKSFIQRRICEFERKRQLSYGKKNKTTKEHKGSSISRRTALSPITTIDTAVANDKEELLANLFKEEIFVPTVTDAFTTSSSCRSRSSSSNSVNGISVSSLLVNDNLDRNSISNKDENKKMFITEKNIQFATIIASSTIEEDDIPFVSFPSFSAGGIMTMTHNNNTNNYHESNNTTDTTSTKNTNTNTNSYVTKEKDLGWDDWNEAALPPSWTPIKAEKKQLKNTCAAAATPMKTTAMTTATPISSFRKTKKEEDNFNSSINHNELVLIPSETLDPTIDSQKWDALDNFPNDDDDSAVFDDTYSDVTSGCSTNQRDFRTMTASLLSSSLSSASKYNNSSNSKSSRKLSLYMGLTSKGLKHLDSGVSSGGTPITGMKRESRLLAPFAGSSKETIHNNSSNNMGSGTDGKNDSPRQQQQLRSASTRTMSTTLSSETEQDGMLEGGGSGGGGVMHQLYQPMEDDFTEDGIHHIDYNGDDIPFDCGVVYSGNSAYSNSNAMITQQQQFSSRAERIELD
mmetsp:Transcript_19197/g.22111  ORF Transcript_19197/g.22111 Transcript_19197/m.22111 type:complete len:1768 (+) Transcript_19197:412-5715(+)